MTHQKNPVESQETIRDLMLKADSTLSFLHHRGYIDYAITGCPTKNEVMELVGKLRNGYEKILPSLLSSHQDQLLAELLEEVGEDKKIENVENKIENIELILLKYTKIGTNLERSRIRFILLAKKKV